MNLDLYAEQIARVSALVQAAPEIAEMDLNPLLGNPRYVTAVDARIRLEKYYKPVIPTNPRIFAGIFGSGA